MPMGFIESCKRRPETLLALKVLLCNPYIKYASHNKVCDVMGLSKL